MGPNSLKYVSSHVPTSRGHVKNIWGQTHDFFFPHYLKTCLNFKFPGRWMLNPQEDGRLDAKRHYVILAKALDAIWPVGHARASAQHCTGMTNWPNSIQCLGSYDMMSLGIKSSAFLKVEHPFPGNLKWYMLPRKNCTFCRGNK